MITAREQCHIDTPLAAHIDGCIAFAQVSSFLVCQSMRGSGASVPEHIHAHAFKRCGPDPLFLPLLNPTFVTKTRVAGDFRLSRFQTPAYGTLLQGASSCLGARIARVYDVLKIPFNLVAGTGRPFRESWVLVFWRTKEQPSHPIFSDELMGTWRFGFSEMLGLFEFKSDRQYNELDKTLLGEALEETTVMDESVRAAIEELLLMPPGSKGLAASSCRNDRSAEI